MSKKILVCVLVGIMSIGVLAGCNKDKGDVETTSTPKVTATATPDSTEVATEEPSDKETEDTYTSSLLGIEFKFEKGLFLEDAVPKQMALMQSMVDSGIKTAEDKFDIQRMQAKENTLIATLAGNDDANTQITVALAPYATADDVLGTDAGVPIAEQPIRQTVVDEAYATELSESIKNALGVESRVLEGEVINSIIDIGTAEAPAKAVIFEYRYKLDGTETMYSVVHSVVPCGKNIINVVAMSEDKESKFDKVAIVEGIVKSMKFGVDLAQGGNIEDELIDDTVVENTPSVDADVTSTEASAITEVPAE